MPDTTDRNSLEYPIGADPVSSIDVIVQALAERVDALIGEQGESTVNLVAAVTGSLVVTFLNPFAAPPLVSTGVKTTTGLYVVGAHTITTTQMTLTVRRVDGTATTVAVPVMWHAREYLL